MEPLNAVTHETNQICTISRTPYIGRKNLTSKLTWQYRPQKTQKNRPVLKIWSQVYFILLKIIMQILWSILLLEIHARIKTKVLIGHTHICDFQNLSVCEIFLLFQSVWCSEERFFLARHVMNMEHTFNTCFKL